MISKWDMKNYIKKNLDKFPYTYKEEDDALYDKETNEYLTSLDTFLDLYRKKSGESFESIYYDHVGLYNVLRCTECGTVIFTYEDENYDHYLKCPTCTDYNTHFEYWTKEDINTNVDKQNVMKHFKEITDLQNEQYERYKKRNGKYDWQIGSKKIHFKLYSVEFCLECNDITKSYFKGLRLDINIWKKENRDDISSTLHKHFTIPLSWSQFYIQFIYRHLGKCHPDLRSKWYIGKAIESK